jgi:hypothetical protein
MKKAIFVSLLVVISFSFSHAQNRSATDSSFLLKLNQQIDDHVVSRNLAALDTLYASDFVFSHGSGRVEGKAGWLTTVGRANYPLRQHDSVKVELHPAVAIVKGKMSIQKVNKDKTDKYHLRYIRVFALRNNRWQMISHNTTHEWHE